MSSYSESASAEQTNAARGTEVFVGGLASSVTESQIREVFSTCGEVLEVRMIKDHKGNARGFGFVRFLTKEAAAQAVKNKAGVKLEGREIGVLPSAEQDSLFLGNLPKDWSQDQFDKTIRQFFQDVVSVDLPQRESSGGAAGQKYQNLGFGFVKFSSHAAAARAYRMGSRSDFFIAEKCHPTVKWREEEPEIDPEELAKVKVAFVRNLPTDMNEDFLKKIFGSFGELEKVVLSKKNQSHVGFVHFAKRSDLDIAIRQLNDKTVPGVGAGSSFKLQVEVARPLDKSRKRAHDTSNHATSTVSQFKVLKGVEGSPSLSGRVLKDLEEPVVADPYEAAVVSLPGPVIDRLLRIMRLGIATRFDIDIQCLRTLKELPESSAISVLDQFMLSGADEIDKGAYLARLIAKYRVKMVETSPIQFYESRASDIVTAGAELPSLSSRSLLSAAEPPLPPQSAILSSRYEPYVPRVSYLDYSPSTRAGLSRTEERNPSPLHRLSGSSPPSYGRLGIGTTLPATLPRQSQPGISRVEEMNLSPLHHLSGSSPPRYGGSGISSALPTTTPRESTRPRVRFDPFTGQPYKFDPFTGEPIVPESNPGHSRGLY